MSTSERQVSRSWTVRLRTRLARTVPAGQLLPDRQPAYVRSWIYVFGVASLAALLYVIASGLILALKGVAWWHTSSVGHFVNSTHLWSVELFFFCMVIHLWGKFFMAAFLGSIGTAFTGYLSQTNFDSQWTAGQAKDGLNAVGIGSVFNVLDTGQMLLWHVMLLPLILGFLVIAHVVLVRRHGVVPPFDAVPPPPDHALHPPGDAGYPRDEAAPAHRRDRIEANRPAATATVPAPAAVGAVSSFKPIP
jgi:quinol-cytochrome oxidoreductase complex cytochrome b subunit